jgi:hypothetical protein
MKTGVRIAARRPSSGQLFVFRITPFRKRSMPSVWARTLAVLISLTSWPLQVNRSVALLLTITRITTQNRQPISNGCSALSPATTLQ